jgi:hypothetical protein
LLCAVGVKSQSALVRLAFIRVCLGLGLESKSNTQIVPCGNVVLILTNVSPMAFDEKAWNGTFFFPQWYGNGNVLSSVLLFIHARVCVNVNYGKSGRREGAI